MEALGYNEQMKKLLDLADAEKAGGDQGISSPLERAVRGLNVFLSALYKVKNDTFETIKDEKGDPINVGEYIISQLLDTIINDSDFASAIGRAIKTQKASALGSKYGKAQQEPGEQQALNNSFDRREEGYFRRGVNESRNSRYHSRPTNRRRYL
jgi:hypothetical protein